MAQVWEATDEVLARRVAVKILHPHLADDDSFVRRFRAEAVAAARLAHPSIVSVYDTVTDDEVNAIVMELVVGTTMRADIDQHGPLQLDAVLAIGTQVADALGAAHAAGLVHRDVKPANILLSRDGRVLVADFGIAKAAEGADLTNDGSMVGTAKYLAPEQVEGKAVDGRSDLYALGIVLYEALTGQPPFVADTDAGTALARLHRDPTPPRQLRANLPTAVEMVVMRAMSRRPEDRFPDAAALRTALLQAGADPRAAPAAAVAAATGERPAAPAHATPAPPGPPTAHPIRTPPPASRPAATPEPHPPPQAEPDAPRPRRRWWPAALVVLVAAAIGAGLVMLTDGGSGGPGGEIQGSMVPVAEVQTFDPIGNDGEKDDLLGAINDDDPATAWRTEQYDTREFGGLKDGVGLVARLDRSADLRQLSIGTPEGGWSAQLHVTDGDPPATFEGWGDPVATVEEVEAGTVDVALDGVRGNAVLIWFTRLSPASNARIGDIGIQGT